MFQAEEARVQKPTEQENGVFVDNWKKLSMAVAWKRM